MAKSFVRGKKIAQRTFFLHNHCPAKIFRSQELVELRLCCARIEWDNKNSKKCYEKVAWILTAHVKREENMVH